MKKVSWQKFAPYAVGTLVLICIFLLTSWVSGQTSLLNKPVDSQQTSTITERIEARKKQFKLELPAPQLARLDAKCQDIQNQIAQLKDKDGQALDQSYETYNNIADKVSTLMNRLKQQAVSTATMQTVLNQYLEAGNSFLVAAESYESALVDLHSMDCQADVEGFAVTLQNARVSRDELAKGSEVVAAKAKNLSSALLRTKEELTNF